MASLDACASLAVSLPHLRDSATATRQEEVAEEALANRHYGQQRGPQFLCASTAGFCREAEVELEATYAVQVSQPSDRARGTAED